MDGSKICLFLFHKSKKHSKPKKTETSKEESWYRGKYTMAYDVRATYRTQALTIFVIDVSASMGLHLNDQMRIKVVLDALEAAFCQIVYVSVKGANISPRYRIAMFTYSDQVYDVFHGVKTITQIAEMGLPSLTPMKTTSTAAAFREVERLLENELATMEKCPAPVVCHITDGEYNGDDPEPVVRRIMEMGNKDGNVLVENIFISDHLLEEQVRDPKNWPGVTPATLFTNPYAEKLRTMSSPLPENNRMRMVAEGYHVSPEVVMMLPGMSRELVEMGIHMALPAP